ncbi:MAG: RecX family transcriptional regulator [Muribaculaceae bacterium]|nr:RecX family transcriptional regulator [Muribaculaceae bacterium]MDE6130004.1 RecX family transcriptional regulator [Muribaculaceae bacterium]
MIQRKTVTPERALVRAEELCVRAERSSGEIRRKLRLWGLTPQDSEKIIASLTERRFIDDRRFCEAFVRDKVNFARWGRRKIALALYEKGVDRSISTEVLAEIDTERYEENLRHILEQKRRSLPEADSYEGRTKLFRFAASRGFEPELIKKYL